MNATYFCNGLEYPATVRLEGKTLYICLQQQGTERKVVWQYHNIRPTERASYFTYSDYPPQHLEVLDPLLSSNLRTAISSHARQAAARRFGPLVQLAVAALLLFVVLYLALVPWLAGVLASRFPAGYERRLGDQIYNSMKADFSIDEGATVEANHFFQALRFPADYPVHITVVKGDVVNAFALPGGHIIVYDKLLRGIDSYEALAALLSHEFVHVQHRHTVRSLFRQLGSTIFLSLLIGDAGAVSAVVLSNANELKNLSYSRRLEAEADRKGAQLLTQRGIGCQGFVHLFQFLEQQTGGLQPSEWMSSHPDLKKRISSIQNNGQCNTVDSGKDSSLHALFLRLKTSE